MLGRTDRRGRLLVVLVAFVVLAGASTVRLTYWQVLARDHLLDLARNQMERQAVVHAQRGAIYDRTGTVLLATTAYRDQLGAYPDQIPAAEAGPMADRLAGILGLGATDAATLAARLRSGVPYTVLAPELTPDQSEAIRQGLADGSLIQVDLEPQPVRVYPDPGGAPGTTLASQLLGFVNHDGHGQYGVEERYQSLLAGRDRTVVADQDIQGRTLSETERVIDPGATGNDLRLTIDAGLQLAVEKELNATWVADGAASASAVVMDPKTGAILAWGSVPGYDANAFQAAMSRDPSQFLDPIASRVYEPGSVMKMFVASAALEKGVVKPMTTINDSGTMRIGPNQIADADRRAMGPIPFQDVIAYSRNVGAARVARMLGKSLASASAVLYRTWSRLGIGHFTGVDVAGEVAGIVSDPSETPWQEIDLANRAFGQAVSVTLLQLARGYSAMVNGGLLVQPHVVAAVGTQDVPAAQPQRAISASLSAELVKLMRHTITSVPWYAQGTLIPGYDVGGKTGTAQIWDSKAQAWLEDRFDFTFVGYVGRQQPDLVIAILIDHGTPTIVAQGVFQQNITSYELFRRIARDAIQSLDLVPLPSGTASAGTPSSSANATAIGSTSTTGGTATPEAGATPSPRPAPHATTGADELPVATGVP
jgi:cell division protein FtsI (penicillin-binding protein 3)